MEYNRVLAIGDIHGQYEKLLSLYGKINFNPSSDKLIFLGDYIQGGEDGCAVLDFLIKLKEEKNVICLKGNTDQMIIDCYKRNPKQVSFMLSRGQQAPPIDVLDRYMQFLRLMPCSYQMDVKGEKYFFCHAGVDSSTPLGEQTEEDLLEYNYEVVNNKYKGNAVLVVGHTQVCKLEPDRYTPIVKKNIIMLDTSAKKTNGKLSCMDVITGEVWQSDWR